MQSKAYGKSVSRRSVEPRLSKTLGHFSIKTSSQCCALCSLQKPHCNFDNNG